MQLKAAAVPTRQPFSGSLSRSGEERVKRVMEEVVEEISDLHKSINLGFDALHCCGLDSALFKKLFLVENEIFPLEVKSI